MLKKISVGRIKKFHKIIYDYYKKYGRDLPWRQTADPYKIVVSEIMLQQTQADRVVPKYLKFIKIFPTFEALAQAPLAKVLKAWSGLGYNRRAILLQKLAQHVVNEYNGQLPKDPAVLITFPGLGPATSNSVVAFAFNKPASFVETNIRSVYIHFFFKHKQLVTDKQILPVVVATLDSRHPRHWYNALMDYGVMLKKICINPSRRSVHYTKQSKFKGSNRQLRGAMLRIMLRKKKLSSLELLNILKKDGTLEAAMSRARIKKNLIQLEKEGFVRIADKIVSLARTA